MSAVNKYYRKISDNLDNIKNSIEIASLLVKSQEVDSKIEVNESNISDNLELINTNKSNISDNLELINTNKSNISDNLSLINTNKSNISSNLTKINAIEENNDKKIKAINDKISSNNNLISNNFSSILPLKSNYVIDNILLFNLNSNKDINFKSNINRILVYETNIFYQFKPNSFIEINESITYKYDNIKLYYYVLKETYVLLDQDNIILDEFSFNIKSKGFIFNNLHIYDNQYFFKVQSDITTLKLKVYLERINYDNDTEFDLQLNSNYQSNFICLKYFKYTL